MNKAKRKNILIDLSDLKHPNCGFGQIAINYSKRFANLPIEGLHFFYLLPNCYPKIHSKNVTSVLVRNRKIRKWFPFTLPKVDINPEKPYVPLNKNDAFQKVQKRRVQKKR